MKLNFKWMKNELAYTQGEGLYLGNICVGYCSLNGMYDRDSSQEEQEKVRYVGGTKLPGIKVSKFYGATEKEVKERVELKTRLWLKATGILSEGDK
jgi:hypothetical protein